jgi:hypothetical protein
MLPARSPASFHARDVGCRIKIAARLQKPGLLKGDTEEARLLPVSAESALKALALFQEAGLRMHSIPSLSRFSAFAGRSGRIDYSWQVDFADASEDG